MGYVAERHSLSSMNQVGHFIGREFFENALSLAFDQSTTNLASLDLAHLAKISHY